MTATTTIDETKLNELMAKVVGDMGAAFSTALVVIGDELGLYRALAEAPATPAELARRTGTQERYVREWLGNQAAGGYVGYDAVTARYFMTPEQAAAFADESSPAFATGAFQVASAAIHAQPRIRERFRTGDGLAWGEHHECLFRPLDFTQPPANTFSAGDTRNFQFWYRDPQAVGAGHNLTDALEVVFCP